jgi:hypothetical protein
VLPALQRRQDRQALGDQLVVARPELVRQLAAVDEHRLLALADDQLGAVLDLVLVAREPPGERRAAVVEPLDDVDEFALELGDDPHACPSRPHAA